MGKELVLPEPGSVNPLFLPSAAGIFPPVWWLVGQDTALSEKTDFRPEATKGRVKSILQAQAAVRAAVTKKEGKSIGDALNNSLPTLRQHALYLEYLLGTGAKDPTIKDAQVQHRKVCDQITKAALYLKKQPGAAAVAHSYDADIAVCQLRHQAPQAEPFAVEYLKRNSSTQLGIRVRLVGLSEGLKRGDSSNTFGSIQEALELPQTPWSKAGLLFLLADGPERRGDVAQAQQRLQEAIRAIAGVQTGAGTPPLLSAAGERLVRISGKHRSSNPDAAVLDTLRSLPTVALARAYLEQTALAVVERNPSQALQRYAQIPSLGALPPPDMAKLIARELDFATRAGESAAIRSAWENLLRLGDELKLKGLVAHADFTRKSLLKTAQIKPTNDNIDALLVIHDLMRQRIPEYRAMETGEVEILNLLVAHREAAFIMQRAEKLAAESKRPEIRRQTALVALRAREKILGLKPAPDWKMEPPKALTKEGAESYATSLDALASSSPSMDEKEWSGFQGAWVLALAGQWSPARARMEKAIELFPGSRHAAVGSWFLIKAAELRRDFAEMELMARAAEKARLPVPEKSGTDFTTLVATSLLEQGKLLTAARKIDEALVKLRACLKEFPNSSKAVECRLAEGLALESAGRFGEALGSLEAAGKMTAPSPVLEDVRWRAAVVAEKTEEWARVAAAYGNFAQNHPQSAGKKRAWFLAAIAYRKAGDKTKAAEALQSHLKVVTDREDRFQTYKELGDVLRESQAAKPAWQSYEQALDLLKWLPKAQESDEELKLRSRIASLRTNLGSPAEARRDWEKLVTLAPKTREGMLVLAEGKRALGGMVLDEVQQQLENGTGFAAIVDHFDKGRRLILAECELPEGTRCVQGQLATATHAIALYKAFTGAPADVKQREPQQVRPRIIALKPQALVYLQDARKGLSQKKVEGSDELLRQINALSEEAKKLP